LVLEGSFGYYHFQEPAGPYNNNADIIDRQKIGLALGQFYPQYNQYNIVPSMSFGGGTIANPASVSFDIRWPKKGATTLFTWTESVTKIWGSHQIKAGIFLERDRMFKGFRGANNGSFDFSRDVNNPFDTNYAYSTALLGYFRTYTESTSRPGPDMRSTQFEWYLQDSWRVSRKLTLDYGLRFGAYTPLWTPNLQAGFPSSIQLQPFAGASAVSAGTESPGSALGPESLDRPVLSGSRDRADRAQFRQLDQWTTRRRSVRSVQGLRGEPQPHARTTVRFRIRCVRRWQDRDPRWSGLLL
jgi:hypothetical protein